MTLLALALTTLVLFASVPAQAATLRVPSDYPTIRAAVDAAAPGDQIRVRAGRHCGATLTKPVDLVGEGAPVIVGCAAPAPVLAGILRIGLFLNGAAGTSPASGTSIQGFVFDGEGVADTNLAPLAFGVFARFASDVSVTHNTFVGTVQAVTNTGGDRWTISHNRVEGLTLFRCGPGFCGGGDAIVIQFARPPLGVAGGAGNPVNRPEDNTITHNDVSGVIPDGHDVFSMVGILVLSADGTVVAHNRAAVPPNPTGLAAGEGHRRDQHVLRPRRRLPARRP